MRRSSSLLPVCALVLAMLCVASLMDVTEGRRGGGGRAYIGGGGVGARGSATRTSGSPRGLSGGTWAACAGSSLLAAAAMLL
ncbi:unknown protein [Oryza sativa Japonica Group]|uniref:Os01g0795600 protein n=5 Tax=Oryza TaxID=4527 RepID=A0A8J8XBR2_ORYSJ|nr:hypothetical protein OsI_04060 [Oryza sativa Indica Group]EAZ13820.1 hypothetical protein OsJ_03745 [Oryza sativa Japonica Group]KAB8083876.1 hypothetical protein EE612_006263 [Oryza sativa]KAF2952788.1 hypothetical protein DAI22_01g362200 [Oryza sativa Japonica Group]BAD53018.1 unknown protein [Oryza sativa Japonica Group]|eukprot:NP_001044512.2 Os01g0795600 [Oryza sativa Japonica Group]